VQSHDEPTEVVIHVNMLKEGWDVTNQNQDKAESVSVVSSIQKKGRPKPPFYPDQ